MKCSQCKKVLKEDYVLDYYSNQKRCLQCGVFEEVYWEVQIFMDGQYKETLHFHAKRYS